MAQAQNQNDILKAIESIFASADNKLTKGINKFDDKLESSKIVKSVTNTAQWEKAKNAFNKLANWCNLRPRAYQAIVLAPVIATFLIMMANAAGVQAGGADRFQNNTPDYKNPSVSPTPPPTQNAATPAPTTQVVNPPKSGLPGWTLPAIGGGTVAAAAAGAYGWSRSKVRAAKNTVVKAFKGDQVQATDLGSEI